MTGAPSRQDYQREEKEKSFSAFEIVVVSWHQLGRIETHQQSIVVVVPCCASIQHDWKQESR